MKKIFVTVAVFSLVLFQAAAQTPKVYVGGSKNNNYTATGDTACYWVNGNEYEIDGKSVDAITVKDGKVYAAGVYRTYPVDVKHPFDSGLLKVYRYWIDGKPYELPDCVNVNSIFVDDKNNVYVIGSYEEKVIYMIRAYWLNGVRQKGPSDGSLRDVAVVNGTVYIAGFYTVAGKNWGEETNYACYWVNGVRNELPNSKNFIAHGIKVINGRKYVAGVDYQNRTACYWIDGKQYTFPVSGVSPNYANLAFAVSNGNIIMMDENNYWVNGTRQNYKAENFLGICFTYAQGRAYVAGWYNNMGGKICYWVDMERFNLFSPQSSGRLSVNAIYVPE